MFTGPINWFNHSKYFMSFKVFVMKTPWLTVLLLWLSIMKYAKQILAMTSDIKKGNKGSLTINIKPVDGRGKRDNCVLRSL